MLTACSTCRVQARFSRDSSSIDKCVPGGGYGLLSRRACDGRLSDRMTKMFASIVCFRSVPGFKKSPVLGSPRFVAYTIVMSALLFGVAMHQVQAQDTIFDWAMDREGDPKGMVEVRPSTLNLTEGNSLRYEIRLSKQPLANGWWVRIHVDGVVYIDGRLEEKGIRWVPSVGWQFNREAGKEDSDPTRWRGVTISAIQDDDSERESVRITHELWDEKTNCPPSLHGVAPVTVGVTDDDVPGIKVSPQHLTVPEGNSRSYTLKLNTQPSGTVRVSVSGLSGTDLTVDKEFPLTFTPDDWSDPQTVTVTAGQDDDAADDKVVLNHRGSGGGYNGVQGDSLEVTVDDDEVRGATVSRPSLSVLEGESETYTVVLHTQPTNRVTVSLTVNPANSDVWVSPPTLRFTPSNWSNAETVRVSAREDADAAMDPPVAIKHEFSGGDYDSVTVPDVTVTIEENDVPGVTVSPTALQIPEAQTRSYTLKLNKPPSANVTVSVNVTSGVGNVTRSPSSVTFTPTDWSNPKKVDVTAVEDSDSTVDSATLSHSVTGATEYSGISVDAVTVTIIETDRPPDNSPATGRPTITGTTLVGRTLTAHTTNIQDPNGLDNPMFHYQWIRVDGTDETDIPGANSSTYRLVSADAGKRLKVWVGFTDDANFTESATSLETDIVRRPAPPPPPPPPPPPGTRSQSVTFGAGSYSVREGETVEVMVRLSLAPAGPVTVPLTAKNEGGATDDDYSGVPKSVVFDAGETVATFTFRALADDVDEGTERVTLGFGTLPSGVDPGTRVTADVSIEEDNRGVRITPVALEVLEGDSENYTVVLESAPTGAVTVAVGGTAGDLTVAPEELTFTTLNWSTAQTVTVTAAEDEDSIVDAPVTLTHTVSGGGYGGVVAPEVEVTILENDIPGVTVTPEELEVTEGSSESYTVVLDLEPEGTVTVTVGGAVEDVTVSPASLIFTTLNWSTAQTVKVMAAEDDDAVVDAAVTLTHEVSGGGYDGVTAPDVEVTIIENDIAGVTVAPEALEVPEGSSEIYTVVLDTEPTGPVTVTVGGATVEVTVALEVLTFTMSDWSTAQTVTVTAAEDADAVVDAAVTLTHTVSGGDYDGVTAPDVEVTVLENDFVGVTVAPEVLEVLEGGSATYAVVLDAEPTGPVTVTVGGASGDLTVSPETLSFTTSNWSTRQLVRVTAAEDEDSNVDAPVTLTHMASGGGYDGVTAAEVEVTILENDIPGVTVTPMELEVTEGSSETYTVVLDLEPEGTVTVTVGGAVEDVTVSPASLIFTTLNWSTAQTVKVMAAEDDDAVVDAAVTLTHEVSGGGYDGVTAPDVEVTIIENDIAGVTVAPEALEVPEGSSEIYTVVLDTEPTGPVTVTVGGATVEVTVALEVLTFTMSDWSTAQTVTVTAAEDADAVVDAAVTLTHTVSGGDYDGVTAPDVEVTVLENDFVGVTVAPEVLEVLEGGSATYAVVLDAEPTGPVTVTVGGASGDLTVSPETLSFTTSNWSTRQLVRVTAAEDEDSNVDAPVTLTHMASGGGYDGVTAAEVEVTILENDIPGVTVTPMELSVTEGSSETYTVVLDTEPTGPVTVTVGGVTGDLMVSPASLSFTQSNWSTAQPMTVMAAEDEDALDDPPVTLTHMVSGGNYAGVTAPTVVVTILENDVPELSVEDAEVMEGDGEIVFAVTMDGPSSRTVRVDWATADGTAKAGEDYTARKDELVFAPGETRQEAKVPVLDDSVVEPDETFTVKLSNPQGGSLERAEATGMIVDNDLPLVSISAASASVDEGEDVQFDLTRSGNLRSALSVTVRVNATGAFLAETPPSTVSFGSGESAAVLRIATVDDERDEPDGTVEAVLVESADYVIQDPGKAVVTVTDNDRPPAIGIESARALEIAGEIVFPIMLAGPSDHMVTVEWSTSDGTARTNEDYRGATGMVNFPPGRTVENIRVILLDDMILEEDETFTVTLGRAVNGTLGQGTATGVIADDEGIVFKAWLTRFGRTVATQVVEAVSERLTGSPYRPPQVTVGGRQLRLAFENEAGDRRDDSELLFGSQPLMAGGGLGAPGSPGRAGESLGLYGGTLEGTQFGSRRLGGRNLLSTSSFHLTSGDGGRTGNDQGGTWAAWGRGVTTQFSGRNTDLSLDGGVLTGLAGVDYTRRRMLVGLAVSRSEGDGDAFAGRDQRLQSLDSDLSASLTSVYPYLRVGLDERLFTWGLFGYGRGQMGATAATGSARHDIGMTMGAVGARGSLLKPEDKNGLELALKTDTFWVGMDLDANAGPRITDADASRTRLLLEAACHCRYAWAGGLVGGAVDFGIRRDAGAAETGMGLEVGGSLSYLNPDRGLTVSVNARRLMAHQADGYREWGIGGMIEYDPGAAGRGLSVRMVSSLGTAPSGTNRFWSQSAAGLNRNGYAGMDAPLTAEVDYRMRAFGGRLQMAPYADMSLVGAGSGAQSYLLGWRLQFGPNIRLQLEVDLGDRSYNPLYRNGLMGPGSLLGSPGLAPSARGASW